MVTVGIVVLGATDVLALQQSETQPQDHPRLHLDLQVADVNQQQAEVERLVSLGAGRVDWDSYPDDPDFVVLADPDGNRFCVVDHSHPAGVDGRRADAPKIFSWPSVGSRATRS